MITLLVQWILSALALFVVVCVASGFRGSVLLAAIPVALGIGLLNAAFEVLFKLLRVPLSTLALGGILLLVNVLLVRAAVELVAGFSLEGWFALLAGAAAMAFVGMAVHGITLRA